MSGYGYGVRGWWRSRIVRPLWWWAGMAVMVSLLPGHHGGLVAIGFGVALAVCWQRWRATAPAARPLGQWRQARAARPGGEAGPRGGGGRVYDPGALVSAVIAILAAEGLKTDGRSAVLACIALLTAQGINPVPDAPAPAAWAIAARLTPRAHGRAVRVVPVGMFATCVYLILDADNALPTPLRDAKTFLAGCAHILTGLGCTPGREPGPAAQWPVLAALIKAGTGSGAGGSVA